MSALIVAGTDTGVGKTVFAAGLTMALKARYWKPVQSGLMDRTDTDTVKSLSGAETLSEAFRLNRPSSPHLSAEDAGVEIWLDQLALPKIDGPLVVEGAGGVMVPLNRQHFFSRSLWTMVGAGHFGSTHGTWDNQSHDTNSAGAPKCQLYGDRGSLCWQRRTGRRENDRRNG